MAEPLIAPRPNQTVSPTNGANPSIGTRIAWVVLLALLVVPTLTAAYESAVHFSGSAIDGPFQLYNALRRIRAGFKPGIDFQFFHGLGVPYAYYWLFRLLGGQFVDSELARQLISAIVFPASSLLFFWAFTRSWVRAAAMTVALMAAAYLLRFPALLFAINSMIGVRSALPMLVPAVLFTGRSSRRRIVGGGIALGSALFFSTEQGLAIALALVLVSAVTIVRASDRRQELVAAASELGIGLAALFCWLALVGGVGGAIGALRYNFALVPMDQYWFFGAPPNPFASSWSAGAQMAVEAPTVGLALLLSVVATTLYVSRLWRAGAGATARDRAFATLAVYGLISCASLLGVFVPVYTLPCWRVLISLGLLELFAWSERHDVARGSNALIGTPRLAALIVLLGVTVTFALRQSLLRSWVGAVPHLAVDHLTGRSSFQMNPMWRQTLAIDSQVVKAHSSPSGPPIVWSTYSGWLEARAGIFNPSYDYVIHALGPENRRAYLQRFRQVHPDLVQTVSPLYSPYESWIENANWDFYRSLLASYAVVAETPWSLIWEQRNDSDTSSILLGSIDVPAGVNSVKLPVAPLVGHWPVTLLQVEVDYETINPLRRLPVIGASPRYLVDIAGAVSQIPVSLSPYTTVHRFPVVVRPNSGASLGFRVSSLLPGAHLRVHRVRVTAIPVQDRNAVWLRSLAERLGG